MGEKMIRFKLAELMGKHKISNMSELARQSGLSRLTIKALYDETARGIRWETLEKLCAALDCTVSDLVEYVSD